MALQPASASRTLRQAPNRRTRPPSSSVNESVLSRALWFGRSFERSQWVKPPLHSDQIQGRRARQTPGGHHCLGRDRDRANQMFQSAPRPRGRGDISSAFASRSCRCFNPRPAHAGGATRACLNSEIGTQSFNPRPAHAGGATLPQSEAADLYEVSIRAPPTRAGRLEPTAARQRLRKFQSAPRPRGRGDTCEGKARCAAAKFQSAPRPRGRGDRAGCQGAIIARGFNPRPAHAGGATCAYAVAVKETLCFNPRPAHAGGAT